MPRPLLVAGVDSSTQSCKYITVNAATGEIRGSTALPHPDGTAVDPQLWWDAFSGVGATSLLGVEAVSVSAQQHTTILLGEKEHPVGEAILWNDQRATQCALDLRHEYGPELWAQELGMIPTAAHPVSKLRWLARTSPEIADRVRRVMVPHDWLTWRLLDAQGEPTTDRSDASGTGYWASTGAGYRNDILEFAFGRTLAVPRVLGPGERAGVTAGGVVVGAGCGDNAAAVLGLGTEPGEAVVSIGTSMTVSMVDTLHVVDPTGHVADMADAAGAQLPIVATLNGARTLNSTARMLRLSLDDLDELASVGPPDAQGLCFLPYLDGERTPLLPDAQGALVGLTRFSMTPENLARAAVLGLACAIADAIDDLVRAGLVIERVTLVGGGSRSTALRQAVADLTGRRVGWPEPREYAALGAARQAAWALTGELPHWPRPVMRIVDPADRVEWTDGVRERHRRTGAALFGSELT
jgi:xylulokinase